jgi:L-alanine-DL-glutamate epimerase-like enolase superfamily enzyme
MISISHKLSPMAGSPFAATILSAEVEFIPRKFVTPLQLSTGTIAEITEARATVEVAAGNQYRGIGRGSIYLSDLWAWPDPQYTHEERDLVLRGICERTSQELLNLGRVELVHPLELGLRLHNWVCHDLSVTENPPLLARAMCASPFDAAIHDAVGQATHQSAFRFYDQPVQTPSADQFFPEGGASRAIAEVLRTPRHSLPAWFLVSKPDNVDQIIPQVVRQRGYYCFKIKITGTDNHADVNRVCEVFQTARNSGIPQPRITIDSNEANPDAASVLEFLEILQAQDPAAYASLDYVEQPTGRDISIAAYDWRDVTKKKPVFLDEGLTELTTLELAREQGWSGFALKTCKGHSMLMACAAWGHTHGMALSLQDLTNPGISLIHGALVAAHLPTVNGAELNSPQFTPEANQEFLPRLAHLFEPTAGTHVLEASQPWGLGSTL